MSGNPSIADLVAAVRAFIAEIEPQLVARSAFHAKVAGNALAIVERELAQSPAPAEAAMLRQLAGHDGAPDVLRADVCTALRDGRLSVETPGLIDAMLTATIAQVAVDNPRYATFKRLTGG
jgi:hypothetical protein